MAKIGRPSIYEPRFVEMVDEYIRTTGREQTILPTIEGFAVYLGVDTDTINNWADAKDEKGGLLRPEFFGAIKRLKETQKTQLMNDGMYGGKDVNSTMAIFLLKANHNMIETERKELVGRDGEPLRIQLVNDYVTTSGWAASSSERSPKESDEIQDTSVAPESQKDIDSTGKDSPGGV